MDALNIDRAALIGNSMGGMTALRFSAAHPDRVSHLIPMGSGAPGTALFAPQGGMSEGMKVLIAAYEDPSTANFRELIEVMTYDSSFATDALVEQRREAAVAETGHISGYLEARAFQAANSARFQAILPELTKLTVPALLIHGRDDRTVPFENSLRLLSILPTATLVLFGRCGHWAQLEHADEFNRLVIDFIRNN